MLKKPVALPISGANLPAVIERGIAVSAATREQSNTDKFKMDFLTAIAASVGVLLIRTREPFRAAAILQEVITEFNDFDLRFRMWDPVQGTGVYKSPFAPGSQGARDKSVEINIHKPESFENDTKDPLKALEAAYKMNATGLHIFQGWHNTAGTKFLDIRVQQYIRMFAVRALDAAHRYVFIAPEGTTVPPEIENEIHVIDFLVPSHMELVNLFPNVLKGVPDGSWVPNFSAEEIDMLAQAAKGMSEMEFLNACAISMITLTSNFDYEGHRVIKDPSELTIDDFVKVVSDNKISMVKRTDVLELLPAGNMNDVGGFDLLKKWIRRRRKHFSDEARAYGIRPPKGIVAVGPPGTGKSELAKAIAHELGLPLILMNIAKMFGKFVGESEGRMGSALAMIDALAPCVLFIDEIDKGFGGMGVGGDGGTTQRTFGQFLTWLQERNKKPGSGAVFAVTTANNVDGLPPELLRPGRFDGVFACLFPSEVDRAEILKIKLRLAGHSDAFDDSEIKKIVGTCDKYTGAEIEQALAEALTEAFELNMPHPTVQMIIDQIAALTPQYKAFPEKIQHMYGWAKQFAKPTSSDASFDIDLGPDTPKPDAPSGLTPGRKLLKPVKRTIGKSLDDK